MKINLVLIQPPTFEHSAVFEEIIRLYQGHIQDLGYSVIRSFNRLKPDYLNIIFAYQFLSPSPQLFKLPYVICQLELLGFKAGWYSDKVDIFHSSALLLLRHARQVWDFSQENISFLGQHGIAAKHIPLGFHAALQQVPHIYPKDIDMLFYGSLSQRRFEVIKHLEQFCQVKTLFGVYGAERDRWIGRSKIVLNIHVDETFKILEQVRISYLLTNRCFVLSEACNSNLYGDGLIELPYSELVGEALVWLKRDQEREVVAERGLENIKRVNMRGMVEKVLAELT